MSGTSREISSVITSAANNYNTRLDSNVRIKTRIQSQDTFTQKHYKYCQILHYLCIIKFL